MFEGGCMSEKKEYIGIFKTSDVKINGKDYIAKIPAGGSELYTRAEAVESMAKALHSFDTIPTTEEQWRKEVIDNVKSLYRYRAETALDALLGGKQ